MRASMSGFNAYYWFGFNFLNFCKVHVLLLSGRSAFLNTDTGVCGSLTTIWLVERGSVNLLFRVVLGNQSWLLRIHYYLLC